VTYTHFSSFMDEFRSHAQTVQVKLDGLDRRMSEGTTRFAVIDTELRSSKKRADDHSNTLDVLERDNLTREAIRNQLQAAASKPKTFWQNISQTVVTGAILGALAVTYNMWRDWDVDKRLRAYEAAAASATASAPLPVPAPDTTASPP